jgi:hypothetical protein
VVESQGPSGVWSTVGSDTNIIGASVEALLDSFEYALWKSDARPIARPGARTVAAVTPPAADVSAA